MKQKTLKIDKLDTVILFGGGQLILPFAQEAIKRKLKVYIFAVKRHLEEIVNETTRQSLEEILIKNNINFFHVKEINKSAKLKEVVTNGAIGIGLGEAYTFSRKTIALFGGKFFDFMAIKLPEYRGGAHFTWQILRQDNKVECWNIQLINEEMVPGKFDSGEILMTKKYILSGKDQIPKDYFEKSHEEGFKLFCSFLNKIKQGKAFTLVRLDENKSFYFPRLYTLKHGFIDWSWNAEEINNFICAFDAPYAGASTFLNGKRVFLKGCNLKHDQGRFHPFLSGLIYRISKNSIFIATRDKALTVSQVVDEKGYNCIRDLRVGQRFCTPRKYIEEAFQFNAEYDTEGLKKKRKN